MRNTLGQKRLQGKQLVSTAWHVSALIRPGRALHRPTSGLTAWRSAGRGMTLADARNWRNSLKQQGRCGRRMGCRTVGPASSEPLFRASRAMSATCRFLACVGACCWWALTAGCCGPLTSLRYGPSGSAHAAAEARDSCGDAVVDADTSCAIPAEGYCGADECPTLLCWSKPHLCRFFGPIVAGHGFPLPQAEGLQPPHARFHPVPTAPVFAQREGYLPPVPDGPTAPTVPTGQR